MFTSRGHNWGHKRRLKWCPVSVGTTAIALLTGCGTGATTNGTAGMAAQSMNRIVGQTAPAPDPQPLPVQLVQFDDKEKTVRIVITTLPVDNRNGPIGHTRAYTEYRRAPMLISVPTGWTVHAMVPAKEPWQIQLTRRGEAAHRIRTQNASHHVEVAAKHDADYRLMVSNTDGVAPRMLMGVHVSSNIKAPMVSNQHRA